MVFIIVEALDLFFSGMSSQQKSTEHVILRCSTPQKKKPIFLRWMVSPNTTKYWHITNGRHNNLIDSRLPKVSGQKKKSVPTRKPAN